MPNWGQVLGEITAYAHNRHIHYEECADMGLNVKLLEDIQDGVHDLQDLVLTVHHCYMHSLMNTQSFKIIENHEGVAFVKQMAIRQVPAMAQMVWLPKKKR